MPLIAKRPKLLVYLYQRRGWVFLGCVFIAFVQAGLYAGRRDIANDLAGYPENTHSWSPLPTSPSSNAVIAEHPIPKLMAEAETSFRQLLSKQSRTLKAAVNEYKKRYKRSPPKGFDLWWKFAKENDVKMVDEYDGLIEDLAPFWEMSGEELRRRAVQAGLLPSIDLVRVRNGTAYAVNTHPGSPESEVSSRAAGLRHMMEKFQHRLPDMDLPVNARAEGRVLVPWEHRKYPNMTLQNSSYGLESMVDNALIPDWGGTGSVWESYRRTCSPSSPARRIFSSLRNTFADHIPDYVSGDSSVNPGPEFSFAGATDAKSSFCSKPWAHYTQGHFFSDFRTIPAVYPVFSPAKAAGYLDIRIPSHYYYGSTPRYTYGWDAVNLELKAVDGMELAWEDKHDKIFWRGALSGGGSTPVGFSPQYHRHRFLRMANDTSFENRTVTFADPPSSSNYISTRVPINSLNEEIMDVAFVKPMGEQHYPGGLEAMMRDHRFGDAVPLGQHWAFKYLVDLDGMSYSGHFMGFMASDSAVLKATVYQEYFSDWIQPWLHFIPLSPSYKEIYNIHAFFSGPTRSTLEAANSSALNAPPERLRSIDGDLRLRRIARAGKQWKKTIGRTIDMEAYVYRLCLEYARLWADDRDSMKFAL